MRADRDRVAVEDDFSGLASGAPALRAEPPSEAATPYRNSATSLPSCSMATPTTTASANSGLLPSATAWPIARVSTANSRRGAPSRHCARSAPQRRPRGCRPASNIFAKDDDECSEHLNGVLLHVQRTARLLIEVVVELVAARLQRPHIYHALAFSRRRPFLPAAICFQTLLPRHRDS